MIINEDTKHLQAIRSIIASTADLKTAYNSICHELGMELEAKMAVGLYEMNTTRDEIANYAISGDFENGAAAAKRLETVFTQLSAVQAEYSMVKSKMLQDEEAARVAAQESQNEQSVQPNESIQEAAETPEQATEQTAEPETHEEPSDASAEIQQIPTQEVEQKPEYEPVSFTI